MRSSGQLGSAVLWLMAMEGGLVCNTVKQSAAAFVLWHMSGRRSSRHNTYPRVEQAIHLISLHEQQWQLKFHLQQSISLGWSFGHLMGTSEGDICML